MKKVLLCIMDGVGISNKIEGNAYKNANTKTLDWLMSKYPTAHLEASGKYVGLPENQMGNSEVGHLTIGAGSVIYQSLEYLNRKIEDKSFFENEEFIKTINHVKENNSSLHIMGLLSDGGIHSNINHLFALLDMCKEQNVKNVYLHLFMDGRDTKVDSGIQYIKALEEKIEKLQLGKIVTMMGRYYAMDRDNNYDRVKLAYDAMVNAISDVNYKDVEEAWYQSQKDGITDEFIKPIVIDNGMPINDNDGIIIYNFRADRIKQLLIVLKDSKFNEFETKKINNLQITTMMSVYNLEYARYAFLNDKPKITLGKYISSLGYKQLRIAETEKYAHVTYFFDGLEDIELENEKRILINSPSVATYDLKPSMSANEITTALLEEINKNHEDLIILNFANGDMVGHTGNYDAAVAAVKTVDNQIKKIYDNLKDEYVLVITADHGNVEKMLNEDGSVNTNHTTNVVPIIITTSNITLRNGTLSDIAPTILDIMDLPIPSTMNGKSLLNS